MRKRNIKSERKSELPDSGNDVAYDPSIGALMIKNYENSQSPDSPDAGKEIELPQTEFPIQFTEEVPKVKIIHEEEQPKVEQKEIIYEKFDGKMPERKAIPQFIFNDLKAENDMFMKEINMRWQKVVDSGIYLEGDQCKEMEDRLAKLIGKKYCIVLGNYKNAIDTVLKSILIKNSVIIPDFWCDSIRGESFENANVICVDVDESLTMDVKKLPIVKDGLIIAVHLFGNNCNMKMIKRYASQNNHAIIEDCSHSIGSGSGKESDISIFSFSPGNPLSTIGDGAAILMDDKLMYTSMLGLKNSYMSEMECAVVNSKMDKFEHLIEKRRNIAGRYKKIVDGIRINSNCIYQQFTVLFNERDKVIEELQKLNIPYTIPSSKFEDNISSKIISLPCHPFMHESHIKMVEAFLTQNKKYEY